MAITQQIQSIVTTAIQELFPAVPEPGSFQINQTKPEFEGDYTVVLFGLTKPLKQSPEALGKTLGDHLVANSGGFFTAYNVIKGFLNLTVSDQYWISLLQEHFNNDEFGRAAANGQKVMVEYSSPNTNKPLHLGHLRNNFLGWSIAEILKASGYEVIKSCIVNDRGIHICKSMIAWQIFANGATPDSAHQKGDHFVGEYYVKFNDAFKAEVQGLMANGVSKEIAEKEAPILKAAQQMLVDWEAGDPETINLWKRMNKWVYEGFDTTYKKIGSDFDITYYESDTYLLGKKTVQEGLAKGVFFQKEDGSVWIDLTADGLDEKLVQRRDGTSVYMTQDIGLAQQKYEQFGIDKSIYVVGDEQNYHFKVLKLIAEKLGLPTAEGIFHLSYGMVELPTGKMKSREGTVVDADDLVAEMISISEQHTKELGKVQDFNEHELVELYNTIGLGALKFYLLRVDPKKKMIFNPEESIDIHGYTGPFIQYTYARIKSILRKGEQADGIRETDLLDGSCKDSPLLPLERALLVSLEQFPVVIEQAAEEHNPSAVANYVYHLAKSFNSFYTEHSVSRAESDCKKQLRLRISVMTANVIESGMKLLGIRVPEKM
ncbi:arginine--tRNA ligase [Flavihumibacter stibioxidans]|uniref:Arginine--tRNA ligase n=1 Tax=Flavihumibacter stibioxidans TaxID=1834163 RepID=A0ABR7M4C3_9BACT|nr:arginine--tRNA ligase [Flavihumibacter stibioxidans]MBC6489473.1 arginine--tRNA ligase [Flavihumibacter stibioxidans]